MQEDNRDTLRGTQLGSHRDWELALVRYHLMVDESEDASPLKSFEVTSKTLAEAAGLDGDEERAVASFRMHVCRPSLRDALEHDWFPGSLASDRSPGYFAYLCLTLLVASSPDEAHRLGGDFHEKLRRFLGVSGGYRSLPGVAKKWHDLQQWLDGRCGSGLPFRRLVLPPYPPSWVHIGLTRKLAFPAKADTTLLRAFLSTQPGILAQPLAFIRRFEPYLAGSERASDGMKESFRDFAAARLAGDRFLAGHPFWRLAQFCEVEADGSGRTEDAQVVCTFDQDGGALFRTVRLDGASLTPAPTTLSDAVAALAAGVSDAAPALYQGMLPFQQAGYGVWRSVPGLEAVAGLVRLGISAKAYARLCDHHALFSPSGDWYFSNKPMTRTVAGECASLAGMVAASDPGLAPITVLGGVRTGGMWLGRPSFLPRIASGAVAGRIRPGGGAEGNLSAAPDAGGTMRLRSSGPVSGPWFVEPSEGRAWSRRLTFAGDAFVHDGPRGPTLDYPPARDWVGPDDKSARIRTHVMCWSNAPCALDDLVEAVYAGGRSGWDEGDLTALIQDGLGRDADPWAMLRVLADATLIQPRLRPQWKGRVWTIRPPSLRVVGDVAIAEGTLCHRHTQEFREACGLERAKPFRRCGTAPYAPALVGCASACAKEVAERLQWPIVEGAARPAGQLSLETTALTLIGRQPASRWDWEGRHFIADGREGAGEVSLTRWSQPGQRDHDVYVVDSRAVGARRLLLSRAAAVVLTHGVARTPLFLARDGLLVGLSREAHLPDKLASWLRLRNAANAAVFEGSRVYAADGEDLAWLARLLPGVVEGSSVSGRKVGIPAISSARNSGGRTRLAWIGGQLTCLEPARGVPGRS